MRRILIAGALTLCGSAILAASASADVIIRGPLGVIIVPAPVAVRVGPGPTVVAPGAPAIYPTTPGIVSNPKAVVRPDVEAILPPPTILPGGQGQTQVVPPPQPVVVPIAPKDFARTFKPGPNAAGYEVVFLHPLSHKAVAVPFNLPPGNPRVLWRSNSLVFDYGRGQEVELRFQLGNKVQVTSKAVVGG